MLNMSQKIYQVHKNKVVPVYANPMAENRCFVKLLDLYQTSYDLYVYIFVRKKKEFQMILLLPDLIQHPWGSIKLCQACVKWIEKKTNHSLSTGTTELFTKHART